MPKHLRAVSMPFWAKCGSCGYIVFARTRGFLNILMREHDSESHKRYDGDFNDWRVYVITNQRYNDIAVASKSSAFWRAIRTNPRKLRY